MAINMKKLLTSNDPDVWQAQIMSLGNRSKCWALDVQKMIHAISIKLQASGDWPTAILHYNDLIGQGFHKSAKGRQARLYLCSMLGLIDVEGKLVRDKSIKHTEIDLDAISNKRWYDFKVTNIKACILGKEEVQRFVDKHNKRHEKQLAGDDIDTDILAAIQAVLNNI